MQFISGNIYRLKIKTCVVLLNSIIPFKTNGIVHIEKDEKLIFLKYYSGKEVFENTKIFLYQNKLICDNSTMVTNHEMYFKQINIKS